MDEMRGEFATTPGLLAHIDQQRAEVLDEVRRCSYISASWFTPEGAGGHWALALPDKNPIAPPESFLLYALAKAWRDFQGQTKRNDVDILLQVKLAIRDFEQEEQEEEHDHGEE